MQKCAFAGVYIADDERIRLFFRKRKRDGLTGDIALADGKENARFAALFLQPSACGKRALRGSTAAFLTCAVTAENRCCAAGQGDPPAGR